MSFYIELNVDGLYITIKPKLKNSYGIRAKK